MLALAWVSVYLLLCTYSHQNIAEALRFNRNEILKFLKRWLFKHKREKNPINSVNVVINYNNTLVNQY